MSHSPNLSTESGREDAPSPFVDTIDARCRIVTALYLKLSAIARAPFLHAQPVHQGQIAALYADMAELSAVVMSLAYDLRTDGDASRPATLVSESEPSEPTPQHTGKE